MAKTLAIPTAGPTLDSKAEVALPHSKYVLLIDPVTSELEAHPNPAFGAPAHPGALVAKFLIERGVTVVLGHHMGRHPAAALATKGVEVREGRPGTTAAALLGLYREGQLAVLSEQEINTRHGPHHEGGHGGHQGGHHC